MMAAPGWLLMGAAVGYGMLALTMHGCSEARPPADASAEPVVVFASHLDRNYWPTLFDRYTEETGVIVIVRQGESAALVQDVILNNVEPPADLLITPTVRGVYAAAEEGALRPIGSDVVESRVAPTLRDPDAFWTALSYRFPAIAYDSAVTSSSVVSDPMALSDPRYRGRLCLSTSADTAMRGVIAGLIDEYGIRETELAVRGWVANLHGEVAASESQLWTELDRQGCGVSLVSNFGARRLSGAKNARTEVHDLAPRFVDIEGMGIARHARNPDGAQRLVEWLLGDAVQEWHAGATAAHPAIEPYDGTGNVSIIAQHDDDAVELAERAGYP